MNGHDSGGDTECGGNQPPMRLIWLDHYGIEPMTDDADPEWDEIIPYEPTE